MKPLFLKALFLSLILIILSSCVDRCLGEEYQFRIRLEIVLQQDETLLISYLPKSSKNELSKTVLKKEIKGNAENQFVEFCFPEEPKDLQIYFSNTKTKKQIKIVTALFENKTNQILIQGDEFHKYFISNKNVKYFKSDNSFVFLKKPRGKAFIKSRKPMNTKLKNRLKL